MLASSLNRCLGSTQHLKNKYGGGYTLDLKCGSDLSTDWENLQSAVEEIFGKDKVAIYESFSDRRTYSVSQEGVKSLMKVFNSLEKCKSIKRKQSIALTIGCTPWHSWTSRLFSLKYKTHWNNTQQTLKGHYLVTSFLI